MYVSASLYRIGKDNGDVRRFLNRLLAVPVQQQNTLFAYFMAVLDAEIALVRTAVQSNDTNI